MTKNRQPAGHHTKTTAEKHYSRIIYRINLNLVKKIISLKTSFIIIGWALIFLFSPGRTDAQLINTNAGDGSAAYSGDGGSANMAKINNPYAVAVDGYRNVYIADYGNNRIRRIDSAGIITTIGGTGVGGYSGDGGPATAAKIYGPRALAVDASGNVYFSDYANNRIRKISTGGTISTVVGTGVSGFSGDGGPASAAKLNFAWGIAVDGAGNLFIADQMNCRIRMVNASGIISTIAGTGIAFFGGDGGPATAAWVQYPVGVALDRTGNLYIADNGNNRVRKINTSGIISTIAGSATYGFTGDGGPSTAARLYYPQGVATDTAGNIYICDLNNNRIRKINTSGIINSIVGNGTAGFSGDGGPAYLAEINQSTGVAIDLEGNVYISDNNNNRIRIIHSVSHAPYFTGGHSQPLSFCPTEWVTLDALLSASDIDTGQTETWSVARVAFHGVVAASYTTTSTGATMTPAGLTYTPDPGYIGIDSFKIRITDGTYSDTTTIHITILPLPDAGSIAGIDSICPGDSITLTDASAGGIWSNDNSSIATISATGLVKGIAPGNTIISYTVTNTCGSQTTFFTVKVGGCNTGFKNIAAAKNIMDVFPNPNNGNFSLGLRNHASEPVHFRISNVLGTTIKEFTANGNKPVEVELNGPAGMYFVTASDGEKQWAGRLIIAK